MPWIGDFRNELAPIRDPARAAHRGVHLARPHADWHAPLRLRVDFVRAKTSLDDSLDVVAAHGQSGGTVGALLKLIGLVIPLRATSAEREGATVLDITQHGEEAYPAGVAESLVPAGRPARADICDGPQRGLSPPRSSGAGTTGAAAHDASPHLDHRED